MYQARAVGKITAHLPSTIKTLSHEEKQFRHAVKRFRLTPRHGKSSGCGWRNGLQIWTVTAYVLNKKSHTADKGWSSSLVVGRGANNASP